MKKLVSVLVVAVMLLSLVACDINGKEAAEKTLNGFMEAYCQLDAEAMKDYLDDETVIPKEFDEFNVDKIMEDMPAELADYEDEFKGMFSSFIGRVIDTISYEVKEVEEKDGEYIFTLDITVPNPSDDIEKTMAEAVDQEALQQIILDKYSAGAITDASTEKEIYDILIPEMLISLEKVLEDIEVDVKTKEKELVITKQDGKWLIDTKKSDLD